MSILGTTRFGLETLFGRTFFPEPLPVFEVDWQKKGYFSGRTEGPVSNYYSKSGRVYFLNASGDGFQQDDTGTVEVVLANLDDAYTWSNTDSPLYPYVQAGKRFRLRVRYGYSIYPIATGTIIDIQDSTDDLGRKFVRFVCENDWRKLRGQSRSITLPLMEGAYSDDIMNAILDAAGWIGGRDIRSGVDVYPYWWSQGQSAAELIYGIAHAEMGSCFIQADGTINYRTRYDTSLPTFTLGSQNIDVYSLRTSKPTENVRTLVACNAQPVYLTDEATLFELTGALTLGTGDDNKSQAIWGSYTYNYQECSAKNCITPVAWTDFTAIDGEGADRTSGVTVTAYFWSEKFKLVVTNNSGVVVFVLLKVRGTALATGNKVSFEKSDTTSIFEPAEFNFASRWLQNVNTARQVCETLFNVLKEPRLIHTFGIVPDDYDLMFGMDLGLRGNVDATENGIYGSYKVIQVIQEFDAAANKPYATSVTIEPIVADATGGSSTVPLTIPFTAGV